MATLKQCDRCKILKNTKDTEDWIRIARANNYVSTEYEVCENCGRDFVNLMNNINPVEPRKP